LSITFKKIIYVIEFACGHAKKKEGSGQSKILENGNANILSLFLKWLS
jgi:hypothetical protein